MELKYPLDPQALKDVILPAIKAGLELPKDTLHNFGDREREALQTLYSVLSQELLTILEGDILNLATLAHWSEGKGGANVQAVKQAQTEFFNRLIGGDAQDTFYNSLRERDLDPTQEDSYHVFSLMWGITALVGYYEWATKFRSTESI